MMQPALLRDPLHLRQLAFVHPFSAEARVQAVEAEDEQLRSEFVRRATRPALGRPLWMLAVTSAEDGVARGAQEIARLSAELEKDDDALVEIVVGAPSRLDGSPSEQTLKVDAFVEALRARTTLPIVREDERLTSREAERRPAAGQPGWRRAQGRPDAAAAAVLVP